jgi:outer membrane receptor protein involved in Fe transport
MTDKNQNDFQYKDKNYAAYGTLDYTLPGFELILGLRFEYSKTGNKNGDPKIIHAFLPNMAANYKLKESTNLKFSYRRSIAWPRLFQLNPFSTIDDPYTLISGNPDLQPGFSNNMAIELSFRPGNSYFAARAFYDRLSDVIQNLAQLTENNIFESRKYNMGKHQPIWITTDRCVKPHQKFGFQHFSENI